MLGLSVSAVETLIFRARRALREQLEESIHSAHDAELAISRQLDGRLVAQGTRGALRAHLRECDDCARFARSQRAQRGGDQVARADPAATVFAVVVLTPRRDGDRRERDRRRGRHDRRRPRVQGRCRRPALVATGVGYEGVKKVEHRSPAVSHAAVVAAKASPHVATPVAFRPQAGGTDQKPFRRASVKARAHRHGKPAVTGAHGRALGHDKEVSVLPPSRVRGHDLKPAKPGRPANPGSNGQHRGNANSHKPPPRPREAAARSRRRWWWERQRRREPQQALTC